jgi:hypothetical protein
MPSRSGWFDDTVSFASGFWKRIKTSSTLAFQKSFLRGLILNKKEVRVKLKEGMIVSSKTVGRNKVLFSSGNMENIM